MNMDIREDCVMDADESKNIIENNTGNEEGGAVTEPESEAVTAKIFSPIFFLLFVAAPQIILIILTYISQRGGDWAPQAIALIAAEVAAAAAFIYLVTVKLIKGCAITWAERVICSAVYSLVALASAVIPGDLFAPDGWNAAPGLPNFRIWAIMLCTVTVCYNIAGAVYEKTPKSEERKPVIRRLIMMIAVPVVWYTAIIYIQYALEDSGSFLEIPASFTMTVIIAGAYATLYMIFKFIFTLKNNAGIKFESGADIKPFKNFRILAAIGGLALPLAGLLVNLLVGARWGLSGLNGLRYSSGMFGDFSSPWFFAIAAANGALLIAPQPKDIKIRLLTLFLKSAGLVYIFYFFIVFLPILPLGFVGLLAFGLGILLFAPLFALMIQCYAVYTDVTALSAYYSGKTSHPGKIIATVIFAGLITLPSAVTASAYIQKANFHSALQYVDEYKNSLTAGADSAINQKRIDLAGLSRTMNYLDWGTSSSFWIFRFDPNTTPIISKMMTNIITGGRKLSEDTRYIMDSVFFDAGYNGSVTELVNGRTVGTDAGISRASLAGVKTATVYDTAAGVYKTWVDLELYNNNDFGAVEYITKFKVPEGTFISDYYLDVSGERKSGILADRRAATLIYQRIVNSQRDPGLLRLVSPDTAELRVFPFNGRETRLTGFELMHVSDFELTIDGRTAASDIASAAGADGKAITKADGTAAAPIADESGNVYTGGVALLSAETVGKLPEAVRKPKYYFAVDCSDGSNIAWHLRNIYDYAALNGIAPEDAALIFASYKLAVHGMSEIADVNESGYVYRAKAAQDFSNKYRSRSGFNFDRAVKYVMTSVGEGEYPVIVAATDNLPGAVLPESVFGYGAVYAENPNYHLLNHDLTLTEYGYTNNLRGAAVDRPKIYPVVSYNGVCLRNEGRSAIVPLPYNDAETTVAKAPDAGLTGNRFKDALYLYARLNLYGGAANGQNGNSAATAGEDALTLLRASFRTKTLTCQTAFIVVETAEQERQLYSLQEDIISEEYISPKDTVSMDGPDTAALAVVSVFAMLVIAAYRRRRQARA